MLGRLLLKLFPKKAHPPLDEKAMLGRNRVGYPTMQLSNEINELVNKYYRDLRLIVKSYENTMFFKLMPSLVENELSVEQFKKFHGRDLQTVYLILVRDLFRQVSPFLKMNNAPDNWADLLTEEVIDNINLLQDQTEGSTDARAKLIRELGLFALESENVVEPWAEQLAKIVSLPADKIYAFHYTLVMPIIKKLSKGKNR